MRLSVCRYRNWIAAGDSRSAAFFNARLACKWSMSQSFYCNNFMSSQSSTPTYIEFTGCGNNFSTSFSCCFGFGREHSTQFAWQSNIFHFDALHLDAVWFCAYK
jgi:hypothetical protein